jgi:hypothetical protein
MLLALMVLMYKLMNRKVKFLTALNPINITEHIAAVDHYI